MFVLILKTPCLFKLKKTISLSHGRTLSGHTWSTANFFYSELELLTSLWQAVFGSHCSTTVLAARRWFTLLGDGSRCSAMAHNCLATHHGAQTMSLTTWLCSLLLEQAQDGIAQRIQDARRLAIGGTTPNTDGRPHGLRPQGRPSPQDESLARHDAARRLPQDTRYYEIC